MSRDVIVQENGDSETAKHMPVEEVNHLLDALANRCGLKCVDIILIQEVGESSTNKNTARTIGHKG